MISSDENADLFFRRNTNMGETKKEMSAETKAEETKTESVDESVEEAATEAETVTKNKSDKTKHLATAIEILIVVMLGVTALCTAWASWIGSLHGGNQATNYAKSNNLAAEGNSEYNAAVQCLSNDMELWNEISDLQIKIAFDTDKNDNDAVEKECYTLYSKINDNLSDAMAEKLSWNLEELSKNSDDAKDIITTWISEYPNSLVSPFNDEEFTQSYFDEANRLLEESNEVLKQGQADNAHGDAYGLVTVLYSITLFLLGISSSFHKPGFKYAIVIISIITFVVATVYMFTIPMPTGFNIANYFSGS